MNNKYTHGYPPYIKDSNGKVMLDHPEYNWWLTMRRYYDLDYEKISGILDFQDYKCPIYGYELDQSINEVKRGIGTFRYFLDHDHKYGKRSGGDRPGMSSVRGFVSRQGNETMKSIDLIRTGNLEGVSLVLDEDCAISRYLSNPPAQQYLNRFSLV